MKPQLKLNDLCCYLPYGLKFTSELDKPKEEFGTNPIWTFGGITYLFGDYCLSTKENQDAYPVHLCKPIFRNLATDLTKEITHGNETFVPLERLRSEFLENVEIYIPFSAHLPIEINRDSEDYTQNIDYFIGFQIVQQLQEWHFWLGNQSYFEKGIILDINELNK